MDREGQGTVTLVNVGIRSEKREGETSAEGRLEGNTGKQQGQTTGWRPGSFWAGNRPRGESSGWAEAKGEPATCRHRADSGQEKWRKCTPT